VKIRALIGLWLGFNQPVKPCLRSGCVANPFVEELRQELQTALDGQPLAPDAPFLDNMTVGDYLDLADSARAELWERWTTQETSAWREGDVYTDAILA
jgi:hypothetical protein